MYDHEGSHLKCSDMVVSLGNHPLAGIFQNGLYILVLMMKFENNSLIKPLVKSGMVSYKRKQNFLLDDTRFDGIYFLLILYVMVKS